MVFVKVNDDFHNSIFNGGHEFSDLSVAESFAFKKYDYKTLSNKKYIWSDFNNAHWQNCQWNNVSLFESSVVNVQMDNCTIENSLFVGVDFRGTEFNNVSFKNNTFISCRFSLDQELTVLNTNFSKLILRFFSAMIG